MKANKKMVQLNKESKSGHNLHMKNRIIAIIDNTFEDYEIETQILKDSGYEIRSLNLEDPDHHQLLCDQAHGILVNLDKIDAPLIQDLRKCRIISRYGVGFDNVDIEAATRKGIWVANVPDYCVHETTEHALALLLGARRQINLADSMVRKGHWHLPGPSIRRIHGQSLGIMGFGRLGQSFYNMACHLGWKKIFIYDPFKKDLINAKGGIYAPKEELLRLSDIITLHIPLSESTFHYLNKDCFEIMKPHALIINTSRGKVIDQEALYDFLKTNEQASAALDVLEKEPPDSKEKLFKLKNLLLSPHMAYYSSESLIELKKKTALNVLNVLQNRPPHYPVNKLDPPLLKKA